METTYRTKIQDIRKCLENLDEAELSEKTAEFIDAAWASLSLACAEKYSLPAEKDHKLITMKTTIEGDSIVLELSKAKLDEEEQVLFNSFMEACKNGLCSSPLTENECMDRYKEIKNILNLTDGES